MSLEAGTPLYFELVPYFEGELLSFRFQTKIDLLGVDRRNSVVFSRELGNLTDPSLELDYTEEFTDAYLGGQGEKADRTIAYVSDEARATAGSWSRIEHFKDGRNDSDLTVDSANLQHLAEGLPYLRLGGKILDTIYLYGKHWEYGDIVSCEYLGFEFSAMVDGVRISMDVEGNEQIEAQLNLESQITGDPGLEVAAQKLSPGKLQ